MNYVITVSLAFAAGLILRLAKRSSRLRARRSHILIMSSTAQILPPKVPRKGYGSDPPTVLAGWQSERFCDYPQQVASDFCCALTASYLADPK